ncbi:MAG: hypothetical protein LIR50_07830 [Bacillota bacterium]|nr:hypothetical protein [Bacillota bacterium]
MLNKRIVCLANSRKESLRCVAGIDVDSGEWIRPVLKNGAGLSFDNITCNDGSMPKLLDVINIGLIDREEDYLQPENYLIDRSFRWKKVGRLNVNDLKKYISSEKYIFYDECKRIQKDYKADRRYSLMLIKPDNVILNICRNDFRPNHPININAGFVHRDINYKLRITDDKYEKEIVKVLEGALSKCGDNLSDNIQQEDLKIPVNSDIYFTLSLGMEFNGFNYKLVAGVIK